MWLLMLLLGSGARSNKAVQSGTSPCLKETTLNIKLVSSLAGAQLRVSFVLVLLTFLLSERTDPGYGSIQV